jgi:PhzF family phenazine biosynthesis protein
MLRDARPRPELEFVGLAALTPGGETDVEVRTFFPGQQGMAEDPVTGSFNAALAQWLIEAGHLPGDYVARQGLALGCDGRVHVSRDASGQVWVGGDCLSIVSGQVKL